MLTSVVKFSQPTQSDLQFIADNMRDADRVEVDASGGYTPMQALQMSIDTSQFSAVASVDGVPFVAFGVSIRSCITGDVGHPWLLGTDGIITYAREFLKHSYKVRDEMLSQCPLLMNYVHAGNQKSIQWLSRLGFAIGPAQPFGLKGQLFHRFSLERKECV